MSFHGSLTTSSTTVISGSLQLTKSNWNNSGTLYVGGDGSNPSSGNTGASVYMNGGSASVGSLLKIWPAGQVAIDGSASLKLNGVDIEGGSLDIYSGQVSGSGGSLTVAAHGEYAQLNGNFNADAFPSVTVNGSLFNIPNGSINLGAGQSLGATNGAIVSAPGGSLNIGSGASVSITDSTVNATQIYIAGSLTLSNAAVQTSSVNLDGFLPKQRDTFNIFIDDFSGSFSTLQVEGLGNWQYSVQRGPNGVALNSLADAQPVPEPGTFALLGLAAPGFWWAWKRRSR